MGDGNLDGRSKTALNFVSKLLIVTPLDSKQSNKDAGDVILICKNKHCVKDEFFFLHAKVSCMCV